MNLYEEKVTKKLTMAENLNTEHLSTEVRHTALRILNVQTRKWQIYRLTHSPPHWQLLGQGCA